LSLKARRRSAATRSTQKQGEQGMNVDDADLGEFALNDEELAEVAGGTLIMRASWDYEDGGRIQGQLIFPVAHLDAFKDSLKQQGVDLEKVSFGSPFDSEEGQRQKTGGSRGHPFQLLV
jgi:hypothetical protein